MLLSLIEAESLSYPVGMEDGAYESVNLLPSYEADYTVPILIGDPPQGNMQATFIPYTMGNYMSVTTKECDNCTAHYYDKTQSKQANFNHATP